MTNTETKEIIGLVLLNRYGNQIWLSEEQDEELLDAYYDSDLAKELFPYYVEEKDVKEEDLIEYIKAYEDYKIAHEDE